MVRRKAIRLHGGGPVVAVALAFGRIELGRVPSHRPKDRSVGSPRVSRRPRLACAWSAHGPSAAALGAEICWSNALASGASAHALIRRCKRIFIFVADNSCNDSRYRLIAH